MKSNELIQSNELAIPYEQNLLLFVRNPSPIISPSMALFQGEKKTKIR